jgi:histone acetyltransferase (RNA polymerase elongator complex component)
MTWKVPFQVVSLSRIWSGFYPTLVIKGTPWKTWYERDLYTPLSLPEAIRTAADMFLRFQKHSNSVIRMGLQPGEELRSEGTVVAALFILLLANWWSRKYFAGRPGKQ